ncbi:hypothetical protein CGCSCA4_v009380 [Colletotrichum siamense]|uniref:Uncharacterized protein n=1 Tax=Colletotrichum siamense TaxID=690259 RepID=A0A9P5EWZ5_COLSI|nr:hypothetical protein CGCSCA4_v009380 [Colletotrichum siamense]KAF4861126.1 hypothetical protein CGCSCA2_v004871 [Colletotrichum siamense]
MLVLRVCLFFFSLPLQRARLACRRKRRASARAPASEIAGCGDH